MILLKRYTVHGSVSMPYIQTSTHSVQAVGEARGRCWTRREQTPRDPGEPAKHAKTPRNGTIRTSHGTIHINTKKCTNAVYHTVSIKLKDNGASNINKRLTDRSPRQNGYLHLVVDQANINNRAWGPTINSVFQQPNIVS